MVFSLQQQGDLKLKIKRFTVKNLISYLFFITAIVLMYGFAYSFGPADPDGKQIFVDSKCTSCHTVQTAGVTSKKKDATDLSKVGDTRKADFLRNYLMKKEKINGKEHKAAYKGNDKDLDVLVKWLESLKTKK